MQTYKSLADVIALAEFAHRNQTDKAGMPYIDHPRRVMESVQKQGALPYVQMAAILHDVTEDTAFTCAMLTTLGIPEAAVHLVRLLDRDASSNIFHEYNSGRDLANGRNKKGKSWYMSLGPDAEDEFYYSQIKKSAEARMIKFADIADNTQEWRLSYLPEEKQDYLRDKYTRALDQLR